MTVMVISLMIIISIDTIIIMIWQHAGSLLPAGPAPAYISFALLDEWLPVVACGC